MSQPVLDSDRSFLCCLPVDIAIGRIEYSVNMWLNIFLNLAALAATSLAQQCYYPSGKVATADIPCLTSSDSTHCCGKTGICLSNGYCIETSEQSGPLGLYRGSCTDRNWGSSCPQECLGDNDFPADAARVARWQKNETEWLYCCVGSNYGNDYSSACADGGDAFTIASASLIHGVAALSTAEVVPSTASSTATSAASISPATSTPAGASGTNSSEGEICADSGAQIGAIGAGVGASLGVISLSAITWAFWERRKRLRATAAQVVAFSKPGYEVSGGFQNAASSTPMAHSPSSYGMPISVGYPHELGHNEQKVELPGSITAVGDHRG